MFVAVWIVPLLRRLGPKFVIVKKGEHGAMFFSEHETYVMPAFPTEKVVDPTGAGDSFAGGMMGYLEIGRASCRERVSSPV